MIISVVFFIVFLYFLFAFLGPTITRMTGKKICAICAAVSLTWLSLLVLWLAGLKIEPIIIAILMGQSIVGIMYKSEEYFKKRELSKFWLVRILMITLGTLLVYFLLKQLWTLFTTIVGLSLFLALILGRLIFQSKQKPVGRKRRGKNYQKAISELEKMMEDCC